MPSLAHIANGELGLSVRNKLNSLIDQYNVPIAFPPGGGTQGSVLFIDGTGAIAQDNTKFFWDDSADILKLLGSLTTLSAVFNGATSGAVTLQAQAVAGSWTMKLPATAGTNLYVLQTDGAGVTSWVPQSGGGGGGMAIGGAVTSGTTGSVLFIDGSATLPRSNANFFLDDTNYYLKLGHAGTTAALYLNSLPAIYEIANATNNNWFEGNAGNFTLTGYGNFGTGDGCLSSLTTGTGNLAIGGKSIAFGGAPTTMHSTTSGSDNVGIGSSALAYNVSGTQNVALGAAACGSMTSSDYNIGIGATSLQNLAYLIGGQNNNIAIGYSTASNMTQGGANVYIGNFTASSIPYGLFNTMIGSAAAQFLNYNTTRCTILGPWPGFIGGGGLQYAIAITMEPNLNIPLALDFNIATPNIWSFGYQAGGWAAPVGLHVYNIQDTQSPTNYERACLDWNLTSNVFRLASRAGGTGTVRLIAIDGFQKAGAPAAGDLPSGTCALINDTSGGNTWLVYNNSGAIRKVQLV